ncbi:hypothetical protein NQD34_005180 [Periophthalmus magnuspinnatus]|uniref:uncharacterized protein LOC117373868 isoform X2 n=1 Tax=Periophthalmus magnuspinnatus TaxID=409849 RepID=UPI0022C225BA|nr:uncharacterized protein LOC117373868 isoform X2 [Periophthalmus magnuspinnatus]KAJ0036503.1 hypothetical protein NQD34_005180 [Periophthalmus magnuspinnatus]
MATWKDEEIRALLSVRADLGIVHQLHGTARDAVVYQQIARRLQDRGIKRTKMQVITKLKSLKKMYMSLVDDSRPGVGREWWTYFQMCEDVWGENRAAKPEPATTDISADNNLESEVKSEEEQPETPVCVRPSTPVFKAESPTPFSGVDACTDTNDKEPSNQEGAMSEPACGIPTKKRKTTILHQVNSMINATMSKLKEMDAAMQAQEDARLKRLMDHEKDMQKSLIQEMLSLHRTISAENHQRHLELVDRVMSKIPPSSSQTGL